MNVKAVSLGLAKSTPQPSETVQKARKIGKNRKRKSLGKGELGREVCWQTSFQSAYTNSSWVTDFLWSVKFSLTMSVFIQTRKFRHLSLLITMLQN